MLTLAIVSLPAQGGPGFPSRALSISALDQLGRTIAHYYLRQPGNFL
jgi:hypothetical protein